MGDIDHEHRQIGAIIETAKYRGDPLKQGVWRRTLCA
jgi:hypothetical protein